MQPLRENYPADQAFFPRKPRILVAPLDWGLGHATRCIPVIYELLRQQCEPWIAAEAAQEALLKQEFPDLQFLPLAGYRVKYGRSATGTLTNILFQSPKIIRTIKTENSWLKQVIDKHQLNAVISDNRFGLYHPTVPSIIITHQLYIKTNLGSWSEKWAQKRNYRYLNRFSECWVPDDGTGNNLAGELSHPFQKPATPLRYIGVLSRIYKTEITEEKGHLLIVLSGPEPQRTILEEKIIKEIAHYNGSATIVRGLPASDKLVPSTNMIKFYNHLPAGLLNEEMNKAEFVISRSGYSTIMDTQKIRKKTILVPTPGQAEQEYLGRYLHERKMALHVSQESFSLSSALERARAFDYRFSDFGGNQLVQAVSALVQSLANR